MEKAHPRSLPTGHLRGQLWHLQAVQGQGVLFVSCSFGKLDDRGRAPLHRPPTEAVICHAHY